MTSDRACWFAILFVLVDSSYAQASETPPKIAWEIENRFRLLKDEIDEKKLYEIAELNTDIRGGHLDHSNDADQQVIGKFSDVIGDGFFSFTSMPRTYYRSYRTMKDAKNPAAGIYEPGYTEYPKNWRVVFSATGVADSSVCNWYLDGMAITGKGNCTEFRPSTPLGRNSNSAEIILEVDGQIIGRAPFDPSDILVLGLGDSYASGEGTPDVGARNGDLTWLDRKCHRSLLSWQSLAAAKLAHDDPHRSVTFVSRACSGALTPHVFRDCDPSEPDKASGRRCYAGIEEKLDVAGSKLLRSQLEQSCLDLRFAPSQFGNCAREGLRQPDLILLSIGGNDLGFGPLIYDAITSNVAYCENKNLPDNGDAEKSSKYCKSNIRNDYTKSLRLKLEQLWLDYFLMLKSLRSTFPDTKIVHAIYPNPLMRDGEHGLFCGFSKAGDEKVLRLAERAGFIGLFLDIFGKQEQQEELIAIRDDFIKWLTGSVADDPLQVKDWEYFGLRGMAIAAQCSVSTEPKYDYFPNHTDWVSFIASQNCRMYWGKNGFGQFPKQSPLTFAMMRNEYSNNIQLDSFVTNGYCKPTDDVTGRWFRVLRDSQKQQKNMNGSLHPNIFGQIYYVNRTMPAIWSALGEVDHINCTDGWCSEKLD